MAAVNVAKGIVAVGLLQSLDGNITKCRRIVMPGKPEITLGSVFARVGGVMHEILNSGKIAI